VATLAPSHPPGKRRIGWDTVHLTGPKQEDCVVDEEQVDGLHFYRTRGRSGPLGSAPVVGEILLMRDLEARLMAVAREVRPDILHAHSPVLNALPALRVGRALGIPVVYEVRAFWEDAAVDHGTAREWGLRYRLTRGLETYAFRRVAAVTTICEGLRGDIVRRGIPTDKVTVIPNAVDVARFPGAREPDPALARELGLDGARVIGFIGSFAATKDSSCPARASDDSPASPTSVFFWLEVVRRKQTSVPKPRGWA
jgi:glycosyltransferase involved in cell wall biosynthesis